MRQPKVLTDRPIQHGMPTSPSLLGHAPPQSAATLAPHLYSLFLKSCHKTHRRYLLLLRFTLAEGGLLLLDTGAFLVDVLT